MNVYRRGAIQNKLPILKPVASLATQFSDATQILDPSNVGSSTELLSNQQVVKLGVSATSRKRMIGASLASIVGLVLGSAIISHQVYENTIKLGESKHVAKLLALPETPGTANQSLQQLEDFRHGNWRFYLTKPSLMALNEKGVKLHRTIEVNKLQEFVATALRIPLDRKNIDTLSSRINAASHASAFKYLDPSARDELVKRIQMVNSFRQKEEDRKAEEAKKTKEIVLAKESSNGIMFLEAYIAQQKAQGVTNDQVRNQLMDSMLSKVGPPGTTDHEREIALQRSGISIQPELDTSNESETESSRSGSYQVGPQGGCFYWSGDSKVYVNRSYCH
jgi:hypothetical protein